MTNMDGDKTSTAQVMNANVNGKSVQIPLGLLIDHAKAVQLAGRQGEHLTVTYKAPDGHGGTLIAGGASMVAVDGLVINVCDTGAA